MAVPGNPASRIAILKKIKAGIERAELPMPFPEVEAQKSRSVFNEAKLSVEETFAEEFIKLGGKFIFCDSTTDLLENIQALYDSNDWQALLCSEPALLQLFRDSRLSFVTAATPQQERADACITACELLVARTGSIVLSSAQPLGRVASVYFPVHIVVARASQIVPDIADALAAMRQRYGQQLPSMINLNTGPSRTADIEKTLVVGVHGPREVYCLLLNQ